MSHVVPGSHVRHPIATPYYSHAVSFKFLYLYMYRNISGGVLPQLGKKTRPGGAGTHTGHTLCVVRVPFCARVSRNSLGTVVRVDQ